MLKENQPQPMGLPDNDLGRLNHLPGSSTGKYRPKDLMYIDLLYKKYQSDPLALEQIRMGDPHSDHGLLFGKLTDALKSRNQELIKQAELEYRNAYPLTADK